MTTVNAAAATQQSASSTSLSKLNEDLDQFLGLLITQLENQDPLDPMDSTEFTNQLVQFSSVEQQIQTNSNLEDLIAMQNLNLTALGVSFIGKNVEVQGSVFEADGSSSVDLSYGLPSAATTGAVTILNEDGTVVYTSDIEVEPGVHEFTWDGLDANGDPAPAGQYTLTVSALTEDGASINATTYVPGFVSGLESAQDGSLLLRVGDQKVPMGNVSKIYQGQTG